MKKYPAAFLLFFLCASAGFSTPWAIICNAHSSSIYTADLGASSIRIYGPFLSGSLGTPGDHLLDAVVTPDNYYALVTNYLGHAVYRIDITDPTNPTLAGTVSFGTVFHPQDIAIAPNGQFAVVSDGFSFDTPSLSNKLAFIDLSAFPSYSFYTLTTPNAQAQAVAVGNDSQTIIICDNFYSRIIYGKVSAAQTGLVSESTYSLTAFPINVAISPDGSTALVANLWAQSVNIYRITGPGTLVPGTPPRIDGIYNGPQSIAFTPDGTKALVLCVGNRDSLTWLRVSGPGNVSMGVDRVTDLFTRSLAAYDGVDVLAVSPLGNYAIAGTNSTNLTPNDRVALIDLSNFQTSVFTGALNDGAGIAVFHGAVFAPANCGIQRLTNSYIFYKEYINRLRWQANPANQTVITKYRLYRKNKGDFDSAYQLYQELDPSVVLFDDRGLRAGQLYTYRMTSVNNLGMESRPSAEFGN